MKVSLYGYELKNIKTFIGREGGCAQASVYKDGKRLGLWSQDGNGGEDRFEFDEKLLIPEEVIKKNEERMRKVGEHVYSFDRYPQFIGSLLKLKDDSTIYEKYSKGLKDSEHLSLIILSNGISIYSKAFIENDITKEELKDSAEKTIRQLLRENKFTLADQFEPYYYIYTSPADFIIE